MGAGVFLRRGMNETLQTHPARGGQPVTPMWTCSKFNGLISTEFYSLLSYLERVRVRGSATGLGFAFGIKTRRKAIVVSKPLSPNVELRGYLGKAASRS